MTKLSNNARNCLSFSMAFWLGRDDYFKSIWSEISNGDLRPSNWRKFVEDPRLLAEATGAFSRISEGSRNLFGLYAPLQPEDFIDGIFGGETFVFLPIGAGIVSLTETNGSALEAVATDVGINQNAVQLFLKLACVFGFLIISDGKLLISKVTTAENGQIPLELDFETFRTIIQA